MKDPFAPYIHLFLLFESLSFLLIQGSARILAGGLTQRKEATFCQQRGYFLVYGPATLPIPQIASPASCFVFFLLLLFFEFIDSSLFISSLRRMKYALAQSHGKFLPLEPPLIFLTPPPSLPPPFFLLALNKYRFRLSELTPVSALYPLLTRIEFRTENCSLSLSLFLSRSSRRLEIVFSPFLSFFFFWSNDAGRRDRKCVGVFAQKGTSTKLNRYH